MQFRFTRFNVFYGLMLVCLSVLTFFSLKLMHITEINFYRYEDIRREKNIYVTQSQYAPFFQPKEADQKVRFFAESVVMNLNMYRGRTLAPQYLYVQKFFSPELLLFADNHYRAVIERARNDLRRSHFALDRKMTEVDLIESRDGSGQKEYFVIMYGKSSYVIGNGSVEPINLRILLRLKPTFVSKSNPYGFILMDYKEEQVLESE